MLSSLIRLFNISINLGTQRNLGHSAPSTEPHTCLSRGLTTSSHLSGGKKFTKLDLAHTYQQIPLDEDSKRLVVINTHSGLFRYNRLPFGIASAPAIFQRILEGILRDIPHICIYIIDDILITGCNDAEHLKTLDLVLSRLEAARMCVKKEKCEYMKASVE